MLLKQFSCDTFEKTVLPKVTTTHTEKWWTEFADRNGAVKIDTSVAPDGDKMWVVLPLADNDTKMCGVLTGVSGEGDDFSGALQFRGVHTRVGNTGTTKTALVAADIGRSVQGAGNGYLKKVNSGGITNVFIVAGNDITDFLVNYDLTIPDIT